MIPLYVIILSVIGGAINMTRKVPFFQKEGEESEFARPRFVSKVGKLTMTTGLYAFHRVLGTPLPGLPVAEPAAPATDTKAQLEPRTPDEGKEPENKKIETVPSFRDQAKATNDELESQMIQQIKRCGESDNTLTKIRELDQKMRGFFSLKGDDPLLGFNSYDDWFTSHPRLREMLHSNWRIELLNQYMYLLSAPFLAIVSYYILQLIVSNQVNEGAVVVVSFSVGLISEKIVSWILGIATGYVRDTGAKAAPTS